MGINGSTLNPLTWGGGLASKEKKKKKYYVPVYRRKENRFTPDPVEQVAIPMDIQVEKYDFILIFPWTEIATFKETTKSFREFNFVTAEEKQRRPYISWEDIEIIWRRASHGSNDEKDDAVKELRTFMRERFDIRDSDEPTPHTLINYHAWLSLAREAIVEKLCHAGGLQMKVTAKESHNRLLGTTGGKILCRIRATNQRLEAMADKINHKLQLKEEIDPGSEKFWHVEDENNGAIELEDEKVIYSMEEALDILNQLHRVGKISAGELEINPQQETPSVWSRRVHALERVADRVPNYNHYTAYAKYSTVPTLRYLYKEYPAVRGKTLFRAKDRLLLGKALVDNCFDLEAFKDTSHGFPPVLESFSPLHDTSRVDAVNLDWLFKMWVTMWRASGVGVGVPCVTHPSYDDEGGVWFFERPFCQPLAQIRDYFGEKIALCFSWQGFYAYHLAVPCLLGIGMEVVFAVRGYVDSVDAVDYYLEGFCALIVIWGVVFTTAWATQERCVAVKWGTDGYEIMENDRPQFQGDPNVAKLSYITNEPMQYFSPEEKFWRMLWSGVAVALATLANISIIGCLFFIEDLVETDYTAYDFTYFNYVIAGCQALMIPISSYFFLGLVTFLNDVENHRTDSAYDEALITKVVVFQVFNNYGALLFTAFGKYYLFDTCDSSCMSDLRVLLYCIWVVRGCELFVDFFRVVAYRFLRMLLFSSGQYSTDSGSGGGEDQPLLDSNNSSSRLPSTSNQSEVDFLNEIEKEEFTDRELFDMYAGLVFQYGYITFFSVALPLLPSVALVETIIRVRLNAFNMCSLYRRPHIQLAEDIGHWVSLQYMFSVLGVLCSVGIIMFTSEMFGDYDVDEVSLIYLCQEGFLVMLIFIIKSLHPVEPAWLQEVIARNKFIVDKFVFGHEDYDVDLDVDADESLDPAIDVDLLKLSGSFKGWTKEELTHSSELREARRNKLRDIRIARQELHDVDSGESFNELLGVGESKDVNGSAVGLLHIRIVNLAPMHAVKRKENIADCKLMRVKVVLRDYSGQETGSVYSNTLRESRVGPVETSFWLDQELPPFTGLTSRLITVNFYLVANPDLPYEQVNYELARDAERKRIRMTSKDEARTAAIQQHLSAHGFESLATFLENYDKSVHEDRQEEQMRDKTHDEDFAAALKEPERTILTASFDLNDDLFSSQVVGKKLVLPLSYVNSALSPAKLELVVGFQFSKLLLSRQKVMTLQDELMEIEKQIAQHKVKSLHVSKAKSV